MQLFGWGVISFLFFVFFCHLALTAFTQHLQLQIFVTFYKMAHPVQLYASLI